jgi:hypothetical protein
MLLLLWSLRHWLHYRKLNTTRLTGCTGSLPLLELFHSTAKGICMRREIFERMAQDRHKHRHNCSFDKPAPYMF